MNTQERVLKLQEKGIMNIIESLNDSSDYLGFMLDENLENPFPVFTARNYEWSSKEYTAALLFDCHFAAKSPDRFVASHNLKRFIYVLSTLN